MSNVPDAGLAADALTDEERAVLHGFVDYERSTKLDRDLGIVLSALRMLEEVTGEEFDDDGGDVAAIERDWNARNLDAALATAKGGGR